MEDLIKVAAKTPSDPGMRRNRDSLTRQASASTAPSFTDDQEASDHVSPQDQEALGHWRLRFESPWEEAFQRECAPSRRRLLIGCGIIGFFSVWIGSANDRLIFADLDPRLVFSVRIGMLLAVVASVAVMTAYRRRIKNTRLHEAATTFVTLMIVLATLFLSRISHQELTLTHPSIIAAVIMYAAIAARQRFRWTLFTIIFALAAHHLLIEGQTLADRAVIAASSRFLELATLFTLMASYRFEWRDRRVWILRRIGDENLEMLAQTRKSLNELSVRDALTGLYNRRKFDESLISAWTDSIREKRQVSLLVVDVDYFKLYNDSYGHVAGDRCLVMIARALHRVAEESGGLAARLGGEEFVVLLPALDGQAAKKWSERLCAIVRDGRLEHRASEVSPVVTISVGVASMTATPGSDPSILFESADAALYEAKSSGRNQARVARDRPISRSSSQSGSGSRVAPESVAAGSESGAEDSPEDALESAIGPGLKWLRFPGELEDRYEWQRSRARKIRLLTAVVVGQIVVNGFIYLNRAMVPDVVGDLLRFHLWFSIPLLVGMAALCAWPVRPIWREACYASAAAIQALVTGWILAQSHEQTMPGQVAGLVLFPLFSGIAGQLPFSFSCIPAFATVASLSLISASNSTGALILHDSIVIVVDGAIFTLIAAYTLEYGLRKEWILDEMGRLRRTALEAATRRLRVLSTSDPLTGISNRRHFDQQIAKVWDDGLKLNRPVSLLILDADHFKAYNDGYGHGAGDQCLKRLALVLRGLSVNEEIFVARLGGEEFAVLLPNHPLERAIGVGEGLCLTIRAAAIPHVYSATAPFVTVSIGVACLVPEPGYSPIDLIKLADDALYRAKVGGRDCCIGLAVDDGYDLGEPS